MANILCGCGGSSVGLGIEEARVRSRTEEQAPTEYIQLFLLCFCMFLLPADKLFCTSLF
jgi:hypothetical protein